MSNQSDRMDRPTFHDLKVAVLEQEPTEVIRRLLQACCGQKIEHEDENHLDLLHYAIQANNVEVVYELFGHGLFGSHQRPSHVPYLHLACLYGQSAIAGVLVKYRQHDLLHKIPASSETFKQLCAKKDNDETVYAFEDFGDKDLCAVDVAAAYRNLKCVKLLLDIQVDGNSSLIEKAVRLNSLKSVDLLLQLKEETKDSLNKAFKLALTRKLATYVDLLLLNGAEPEAVLNGMNAYHIMYMYSSAFQTLDSGERHYGLADTTSVLIKHNLPVNTWLPPGSLPLHSLIHAMVQEKDYSPATIPKQHIRCLRLLLEAGADPNIDEVEETGPACDETEACFGITVGRDLYTSGLNALFTALQQSDNWSGFDASSMDLCCKLILQHGGRASYRDSFGETPLHDLMKSLAMQHAIGNMHLNFSCMLKTLLKYGANPNRKSSNNMYPFHHYFTILFSLMGGNIAFHRWRTSNCSKQVIWLLQFMDPGRASSAWRQLLDNCHDSQEAVGQGLEQLGTFYMPTTIISYLEGQITHTLSTTSDLQTLCHKAIWTYIGRDIAKMDLLPVPASIKRDIINMFL